MHVGHLHCVLPFLYEYITHSLKNKSWKPECVLTFNMDWWILVFYPEPQAKDKIY